MGGTFDPIHLGHLLTAESAREALELDEVVFVPAARPPHRGEAAAASAEHRYAMALIATAAHPAFRVSRVEIERDGPSYSIDTVRHFQAEGQELFFLLGADAVLEIATWRSWRELLAACTFVALPRPGYDLARLHAELPTAQAARVRVVEAPGIEVSATEIRRRVRAGRSIRYLAPEGVCAYIAKHGLYRD